MGSNPTRDTRTVIPPPNDEGMHPLHLRRRAIELYAAGMPFPHIHRTLGLPRKTVASWLTPARTPDAVALRERCPLCERPPRRVGPGDAYAYLLGQYLGDGHLLMTRRVPLLTVTCDNRHPGLIHEVTVAMEACGARTVGYSEKPGCISIRSHWMHWPCLIPQHGKGLKHLRRIALADWQASIVAEHTGRFLRGLFHSDGSRFTNRVRRNGKDYNYPRYMFVNESTDIMDLCRASLDRLGISWRMARPDSLSVARREAVAELDRHVGPKW